LGGYVENPFFNHLFLHIWALIIKVNQQWGFYLDAFTNGVVERLWIKGGLFSTVRLMDFFMIDSRFLRNYPPGYPQFLTNYPQYYGTYPQELGKHHTPFW